MHLLAGLLVLLAAMLLPTAAAAERIALTNARVIDGTGAPPQDDRTIIVENGRIAAILDSRGPAPEGARVLDLDGLTLMPGLIDSHVHFVPPEAREGARIDFAETARQREADMAKLLRSGVTTVRELAGNAGMTGILQRRQADGEIEGPNIRYAAVFYGPRFLEDERSRSSSAGYEPGFAPWSRLVTPDLDIAAAMQEAKASGATGVKLYASLTSEQLAELSREARRQGLLVWTHSVVFPTGTLDVLAAGTDTLVHSKGMVTIAGIDGIPDNYNEGTRKWMRSRPFADIDPDGPAFRAAYAQMVRQGTILEPALMADGERRPKPLPDWLAGMRDWACRATGAANRAGVMIGAGTDGRLVPGELQRELELLVDCGLTPLEAIRAATQTNARALGMADTHGTVEVGKAADLIAVAGDPASDVGAAKDVRLVMQAGRLVVSPD